MKFLFCVVHFFSQAAIFLLCSEHFVAEIGQVIRGLFGGTIPIVRVTGGLDDSVIDIAADEDRANGIKFREPLVGALAKAIRKALVLFSHPDLMQHFRENAMSTDFSWNRTTAEYLKVYEIALETKRTK